MIACKDCYGACEHRKFRAKGPSVCKSTSGCDMKRYVPAGKVPKPETESEK